MLFGSGPSHGDLPNLFSRDQMVLKRNIWPRHSPQLKILPIHPLLTSASNRRADGGDHLTNTKIKLCFCSCRCHLSPGSSFRRANLWSFLLLRGFNHHWPKLARNVSREQQNWQFWSEENGKTSNSKRNTGKVSGFWQTYQLSFLNLKEKHR